VVANTLSKSEFEIGVVEVVGDAICVSQDDGQRLFEVLRGALDSGQNVALSFVGVRTLTTAFLNAAVGQLLRFYSSDELRARVLFRALSGEQVKMLREVIERAGHYFSDPERFVAATAGALGD